jgi:hypothetical protein
LDFILVFWWVVLLCWCLDCIYVPFPFSILVLLVTGW